MNDSRETLFIRSNSLWITMPQHQTWTRLNNRQKQQPFTFSLPTPCVSSFPHQKHRSKNMEIIRNNRNNFEDERISHNLNFNSVSAAAPTAPSSRIEIFISNFFSASLSHLNSFVSGAQKSTQKTQSSASGSQVLFSSVKPKVHAIGNGRWK